MSIGVVLGLWCLMPLSITFQLYRGGVLLMEEIRENHIPVPCHWQFLSHNVVSSRPRPERGSNSTMATPDKYRDKIL